VMVKLPAAVVVTPLVPIEVTPAKVVIFGWLALELFRVPYNTALALPIVAAFTVLAVTVAVVTEVANAPVAPLSAAPVLPIVAAFTVLAVTVGAITLPPAGIEMLENVVVPLAVDVLDAVATLATLATPPTVATAVIVPLVVNTIAVGLGACDVGAGTIYIAPDAGSVDMVAPAEPPILKPFCIIKLLFAILFSFSFHYPRNYLGEGLSFPKNLLAIKLRYTAWSF